MHRAPWGAISKGAFASAWALFAVCGLALASLPTGARAAECADHLLPLRGSWGQAVFQIETVDTPESRAQGLMHREDLPRMSGMFFVYETPQRVAFWMKNTLIPLDIIFIDAAGRVVHVHHRAIPGDLTPIEGKGNVLAVLEINGGLAKTLGISAGSELRHEVFSKEIAFWPC